jgi:hypothetical protein
MRQHSLPLLPKTSCKIAQPDSTTNNRNTRGPIELNRLQTLKIDDHVPILTAR